MNSKLKKILAMGLAVLMGISTAGQGAYAEENLQAQAVEYDEVTITPDSAQQKYTISVKNISVDVTAVYMPVWSVNNGQDDIRWYSAQKVSDDEWQCVVDVKDHKSDSGKYEVHVYGTLLTNQLF